MKIPNVLLDTFAFIGALSVILMTFLALEKSPNATSNINTVGKYQIAASENRFHVINTETGEVQSFKESSTGSYHFQTLTNTK